MAGVKQRNTPNGKQNGVTENKETTKTKYWDPLTEGVKWIENYTESLEKFLGKMPEFITTIIATLAIFTFGATLRGEWVVILIAAMKQITGQTQSNQNVTLSDIFHTFTSADLKMEGFGFIFIIAHVVSFGIYFIMGGFLHWYFYVNRRHLAHEWKIQPTKWLSPELEKHEIMVGTLALLVTGSFSAFLACYILNENPSTVYYQFDEYGWFWFFMQFPVIFVYSDYTTYILHRLYHTRFLYKHFHKLHHKYKQPTAFSVTAIHPFEIMHVQLTMCLPLFTVPVHWLPFYVVAIYNFYHGILDYSGTNVLPFYVVAIYNFYHGILDHSGIAFKAQWWQPWQPDAEFHDQHHEFFHCNFGFNMFMWDKLHGTMRKKDLVYTEDTFLGEAPSLNTTEGKKLIENCPDLKEAFEKTEDLTTNNKYVM